MKMKTSRLGIRLSAREHQTIKLRASRAGLSISQYIRLCALRDGDKPVIRTDVETLRAIHVNLRRAGSNLNQCARELNTHHKPDRIERELEAAFRAVAEAADEVASFIRDARESV